MTKYAALELACGRHDVKCVALAGKQVDEPIPTRSR